MHCLHKCFCHQKGGVPTYTQNRRTLGTQPDFDPPYCIQTSIFIRHLVCRLTPVSTYYELKTHHSQQQNNTDRALVPASLHSNTHTDQPKNIFMLHIQIIYTPRAQAPCSSKFIKTHDFTMIVQTFSLSQNLYCNDQTKPPGAVEHIRHSV
jgi:hypothetical protein